jgi:hypothetical protein
VAGPRYIFLVSRGFMHTAAAPGGRERPRLYPTYRAEHPDHLRSQTAAIKTVTRDVIAKRWANQWTEKPRGSHVRRFAPEPTKKVLILHKAIPRSIRSIITQMRTGKIGLRGFLHERRVPGSEDLYCPWERDSPIHIHKLQEFQGRER